MQKALHGLSQDGLDKLFKSTTEFMAQVFHDKNTDYDDGFNKAWDTFGPVVYYQRMFEKVSRLITLSQSEAKVADEKIEDTILDIATYSVIALMRMQNKQLFGGKENAEEINITLTGDSDIAEAVRERIRKVSG